MKMQIAFKHSFYIEGWVVANQLQVGMNLQTMNGIVIITDLRKERTDEVIPVYNFRVSGWSSYFVSEWNVYVHNGEGYKKNSETGLNSIGDYKSGTENLYTKDDIIKMLDGKTMQSTKIANGLKTGKIKLNVLGDELFESYLGVDKSVVAQQVGRQIYVRRGSQSMFSDLVHEGTHVMDYINKFGINGVSKWSWEKRAYFYERQYQIATGSKVDYSTIDDMLVHIFSNYDRGVYNPYNSWQNR